MVAEVLANQVRSSEMKTPRNLKVFTLSSLTPFMLWGRDDVTFPPEVCDDLFDFCGVQWEVVHWTPYCQALYLIPVCRLVSWDEPHECCVTSEYDEDVWRLDWCAVVGVQGVEQWAQHADLRHGDVLGDRGGDALRSISEKVLDPGTDGGREVQVQKFTD